MSRQIQIRRGTAAQHNDFTGAIGEITMDTTNKTLRVHDGSTPGGNEIMSTNKFYSNITNCIAETPQDIRLTIDDSYRLILDSGSNAYLGGGTKITTATNLTYSTASSQPSIKFIVMLNSAGTALQISALSTTTSAATNPGGSYRVWFNTTDGKCYWNDGSENPIEYSLPIAIVTHTNGTGWTKIDQVFNGFGYIGSTIFVLPGLKALAPNGRNADGTLKSTICTRNTVGILTRESSVHGYTFAIKNDGSLTAFYHRPSEQEEYPGGNYRCWYKPSENKIYNSNTGQGTEAQVVCAPLFFFNTTSGDYNPKHVFHAIDYNNTDFIARQAMPSAKYTSLTLGTTGSYYTAQANGYYVISKQSVNANEYITLLNTASGFSVDEFCPAGMNARLFIPVAKGDVIQINYTLTGTTGYFRFVYANGAK